jgi:hypothetical protein
VLIIALLVMVFLVVFSTLTLFRQYDEIAKFTSERPKPVEISPLEDREELLVSLAERLEGFRHQLSQPGSASLELTTEEINLCIAAFEPLKELRGTFRVRDILPDGRWLIDISFQLNGKPRLSKPGESGWIQADPRFLNGTLIAKPALLKHEIALQIESIDVPNAKVPAEFIGQMSPYRISERYLTDPVIGPAMAAVNGLSTRQGVLVLSRTPGQSRPDEISNSQVDQSSGWFFTVLGVAAVLFLMFAALVVILAQRKKSRLP